jgi:hypothetical protein
LENVKTSKTFCPEEIVFFEINQTQGPLSIKAFFDRIEVFCAASDRIPVLESRFENVTIVVDLITLKKSYQTEWEP